MFQYGSTIIIYLAALSLSRSDMRRYCKFLRPISVNLIYIEMALDNAHHAVERVRTVESTHTY
jgi:hypothetical protein